MHLSNAEWKIVKSHLTIPKPRPDGRGRPRADDQKAFEAIIYVLTKGVRWNQIPYYYPCYVSCFERYQKWSKDGCLQRALAALLEIKDRNKELKLTETIFDGSFISSKKTVKGSLTAEKATVVSGAC
jgi:transposase